MKDIITDYFASMVFDDDTMKERLPEDTYLAMRKTIKDGRSLDIGVANVVAKAMKEWAIEKGATHFTHWFQPMTGITAEKHDSFISPSENGKIILEFSGKELVKGEPDASSFPSGGLRATFEARGYTAWDPTSYAFIKDDTLCIPTAFCSYGGEALDNKTPLLRSMELVEKQALRLIKLFGNENVNKVRATVGAEQEYFLIEKSMYEKRKDLIITGRTLFGAKPPKGQELEDHYFGAIKPRVKAFMTDLDKELWKLGVLAKTEHNEAAPAQHELAPVYTTTNIATDHNQLTMELMQKIARKHDMVCLLHEKPFEGVNGSGKHNNWSLSTDTGINLFEPGETPSENAQFLLFLCAVIKAVDEYQDLLRIAVASAGNDHRLGGNEAPPAIVSIFLGEELSAILDAIENESSYNGKEKEQMRIGVHVLPKFPKDTTDRNRTSPFAFTGNKFEFRMLGSSASISDVNTVINTAVGEVLSEYSDALENSKNFEKTLHSLIVKTIKEHKRIIFNGNGYDDEWVKEAKERGLLNLATTPDAIPYFILPKNIELFTKNKVLSSAEIYARYEIMFENYNKKVNIEGLTMVDMVRKEIEPSVSEFSYRLAKTIDEKSKSGVKLPTTYESEVLTKVAKLQTSLYRDIERLDKALQRDKKGSTAEETANYIKSTIIPLMKNVRKSVDELEKITPKKYWSFPSYSELLFGVQ